MRRSPLPDSILEIEAILHDWISRSRDATKAYHNDARYAFQVHRLRQILAIVDSALQSEGISREARIRVAKLVIYGGVPDEQEALDRMEATENMATEAAATSIMWNER